MGGGDLNLKKSWHTGLMSNQKKVWEAEQTAVAERKKIEQVRREREEEREIEELDRLAEANGGVKRKARVDWMYNGNSTGPGGTTEEQEAYLLGKRKVHNLLKQEDDSQTEKAAVVPVDPVRDMASKVAMDPLLLIERQRQEALEKAAAMQAKIEERNSRREKGGRSSRRSDDRHNRRHRSDRDRSRERRGRDRSRDGKRSYSRDRSREHRSRRDRSRDRRRERKRERTRSPYRKDRSRRDSQDNRDRARYRRRSPSEDHRSRSPSSGSPHAKRAKYDDRISRRNDGPPNGRRSSPKHFDKRRENTTQNSSKDADDRASRLAAMQSDASNLEEDRLRRLEALARLEAEEKSKEDSKRSGMQNNFKASMWKQTEGVGLGDRLKGGRRPQPI